MRGKEWSKMQCQDMARGLLLCHHRPRMQCELLLGMLFVGMGGCGIVPWYWCSIVRLLRGDLRRHCRSGGGGWRTRGLRL